MKVGLGLLTFQRHPDDPRDWTHIYRDVLDLAVGAERLGFDSVWTSEHHFVDDGYAPSLLAISSAIAARTKRITIGTGLLLAPLYNPLRLAEDAATVSLISNGRFILGIGAGWRDEEFDLLGVPMDERPKRMRETVKSLRKAWGSDSNVTPKPARPIPIWMGGFADGAIKRAGRIGDGFLGSSSGTQGIAAFEHARDLTGRTDGDFTFALHVPVYVGPWHEVKPWYHALRWKYADMRARHDQRGLERTPPPDDTHRDTIICGPADEVVRQIREYREALGPDVHFICRSYFPGMPPDQQLASVERLGVLLEELR